MEHASETSDKGLGAIKENWKRDCGIKERTVTDQFDWNHQDYLEEFWRAETLEIQWKLPVITNEKTQKEILKYSWWGMLIPAVEYMLNL